MENEKKFLVDNITTIDGGDEGWNIFLYPVRITKLIYDERVKDALGYVNAALALGMDPKTTEHQTLDGTRMVTIWTLGNKTKNLSECGAKFGNTEISHTCPYYPVSIFENVKEGNIIPELHVHGWSFREKIIAPALQPQSPENTMPFSDPITDIVRVNYDIILKNVTVSQKGKDQDHKYKFASYGNFEDVMNDLKEAES